MDLNHFASLSLVYSLYNLHNSLRIVVAVAQQRIHHRAHILRLAIRSQAIAAAQNKCAAGSDDRQQMTHLALYIGWCTGGQQMHVYIADQTQTSAVALFDGGNINGAGLERIERRNAEVDQIGQQFAQVAIAVKDPGNVDGGGDAAHMRQKDAPKHFGREQRSRFEG